MKKKTNEAKLEKRNLLRAHEYEENLFLYQCCKYNENRHYPPPKGYLAYNKLKHLNTKNPKISGRFNNTHGITVGTDHPQCAESPSPIVKCANCNRIPIQNCM